MRPSDGNNRMLDNATERAEARLSFIAQVDTVMGGARALVIARRAAGMKWLNADFDAVVNDQYHRNGEPSPIYSAFECSQCGAVHQGVDNARDCCSDGE